MAKESKISGECLIGKCPKCHTAFEFLGEPYPSEHLCPECKSKGHTVVGVIQFKPEKPTLRKAAKELLKYIEDNNVNDTSCDDGDGYIDEWCSDEFETLINNVKEALKA